MFNVTTYYKDKSRNGSLTGYLSLIFGSSHLFCFSFLFVIHMMSKEKFLSLSTAKSWHCSVEVLPKQRLLTVSRDGN